jgi:sugar phosphate permease
MLVAARAWLHVMPGMSLLGIGAGIAFNPVLMAATSDVDAGDAGLASGVVNTAFMMGGALGLAILASLAASRTASLEVSGTEGKAALTGGYAVAFLIGAAFSLLAAVIGFFGLRDRSLAEGTDPSPMETRADLDASTHQKREA